MAYSKSNNTKQEISSKNFESHAVGPGSDNAIGATDMYIPADAPNTQLNALIPAIQEDFITFEKGIKSVEINRTFGSPEDYIELHIYNNSNQLIASIPDFKDFNSRASFPSG